MTAEVNNYTVGCSSLQVQSNQKLDASLARIEQRGRPQDNLPFSFVRNDCSGSQPAACATRSHMPNPTTTTTISNSTITAKPRSRAPSRSNITHEIITLSRNGVTCCVEPPANHVRQHSYTVSNSSNISNIECYNYYSRSSVSVEVAI